MHSWQVPCCYKHEEGQYIKCDSASLGIYPDTYKEDIYGAGNFEYYCVIGVPSDSCLCLVFSWDFSQNNWGKPSRGVSAIIVPDKNIHQAATHTHVASCCLGCMSRMIMLTHAKTVSPVLPDSVPCRHVMLFTWRGFLQQSNRQECDSDHHLTYLA